MTKGCPIFSQFFGWSTYTMRFDKIYIYVRIGSLFFKVMQFYTQNKKIQSQVSRQKKDSIMTQNIASLLCTDPQTEISGPPEVFLSKGSTLNLTCIIRNGPTHQPFIIWTHNSKVCTSGIYLYMYCQYFKVRTIYQV